MNLPFNGCQGPSRAKRRFLVHATGIAGASLCALPADAAARPASPVCLTLTGAITRTNRPGFDPAMDILMGKHGAKFDKALALDYAALAALPAQRINVTLEYDENRHELGGPQLVDVLRLAGVDGPESTVLAMRAVDGYSPMLTLGDARRYGYIVALRMDDRPLALGGLGPLWAVYEADRFPDMASRPVNQRFASSPWALYHLNVEKA